MFRFLSKFLRNQKNKETYISLYEGEKYVAPNGINQQDERLLWLNEYPKGPNIKNNNNG